MIPHDSPLAKYYRQPKVYLSLPSKGNYYPNGTMTGDPLSLPVYGMTAMDEIMFKTPDALFSGESTVSVIKSCIPDIKDPWTVPQIDIDAILIAIRIATYGEMLQLSYRCKSCKEHNDVQFNLAEALEYFDNLTYENKIFCDPLTIVLRPYNYKEYNSVQIELYSLQRMLNKSFDETDDKQKSKLIDDFSQKLAKVQLNSFKNQIAFVEAEESTVSNQQEIVDWINNSEKSFFDKIKNHIEQQRDIWQIQDQRTQCSHCEHENIVKINLDHANFFVKS